MEGKKGKGRDREKEGRGLPPLQSGSLDPALEEGGRENSKERN